MTSIVNAFTLNHADELARRLNELAALRDTDSDAHALRSAALVADIMAADNVLMFPGAR